MAKKKEKIKGVVLLGNARAVRKGWCCAGESRIKDKVVGISKLGVRRGWGEGWRGRDATQPSLR